MRALIPTLQLDLIHLLLVSVISITTSHYSAHLHSLPPGNGPERPQGPKSTQAPQGDEVVLFHKQTAYRNHHDEAVKDGPHGRKVLDETVRNPLEKHFKSEEYSERNVQIVEDSLLLKRQKEDQTN